MTNSLDLSAKSLAPKANSLRRNRLLRVHRRQVTAVLAPAGHGKTTLMAHWAEAFPGLVTWYRLDVHDRRPDEAAAGIQRALSTTIGEQAGVAICAEAPLTGLAESFERVCGGRPALLVLDDFHTVAGSASEELLTRFICFVAAKAEVVLGARPVAALQMDRLRLSDAVHVVGQEDLRFRTWEVEDLFQDVYDQPLAPSDAARLTRRTEGWAAGLAMFHLLITGRSPSQRSQAVAELARGSRLVRSYLVREVLGDLRPSLREFLRRTSALQILSGPLCDALLGRDGSQAVLENLEQRGLFTTSDDDGRHFRYHQVLQDHLELELTESLGPAESRRWYAQAAHALVEAGEVRAAFRARIRAEDWAGVEQLLAARGAEVIAGPLGSAVRFLPSAFTAQDPWLLLAQARRLASAGSIRPAVDLLRDARALADDPQLADLCGYELRALAQWLPDADMAAHGWAGVIRSATQQPPRRGADPMGDADGCETQLAAAVAALLAGDIDDAQQSLHEVCAHPAATTRLVGAATCALAGISVLFGDPEPRDGADAVTELEAAVLDADLCNWPWLARIGRAVRQTREIRAGGSQHLRRLWEEADADQDSWGAALIRLLSGAALPSVAMLRDAEDRFTALDAPVLAVWAGAMAQSADPGPEGVWERDLGPRIRALGLQAILAAVARWSTVRAAGQRGRREPPVTATRPELATPRSSSAGRLKPPAFDLRVLGGFRLHLDGRGVSLDAVRPRARSALHLLAVSAGDLVHRDCLVAALWPDAEPATALRSLQVAISSLRTALSRTQVTPVNVIKRVGDSYGLVIPAGGHSDLRDFESCLAVAGSARRRLDGAGEIEALEAALQLYAGDLLPEEGLSDWVVGERHRLHLLAAGAAERLAQCQQAAGDLQRAIDAVWRCLRLDTYRDSAWHLLVELHMQSGDRAAAQSARIRHNQVLTELGLPVTM